MFDHAMQLQLSISVKPLLVYLPHSCNAWLRASLTCCQLQTICNDPHFMLSNLLQHFDCHLQVVHMDMKSKNILLDKDYNIAKIGDVGLARVLGNTVSSQGLPLGTFNYAAPELLVGDRELVTEKVCKVMHTDCYLSKLLPSHVDMTNDKAGIAYKTGRMQ